MKQINGFEKDDKETLKIKGTTEEIHMNFGYLNLVQESRLIIQKIFQQK